MYAREEDSDRHGSIAWYWCVSDRGQLVLVQILAGNIVFRDLVGMHFPRILIVGFLYTRHSASLKDVSFFHQFIDAFRVRLRHPGQTFQVCRLTS